MLNNAASGSRGSILAFPLRTESMPPGRVPVAQTERRARILGRSWGRRWNTSCQWIYHFIKSCSLDVSGARSLLLLLTLFVRDAAASHTGKFGHLAHRCFFFKTIFPLSGFFLNSFLIWSPSRCQPWLPLRPERRWSPRWRPGTAPAVCPGMRATADWASPTPGQCPLRWPACWSSPSWWTSWATSSSSCRCTETKSWETQVRSDFILFF